MITPDQLNTALDLYKYGTGSVDTLWNIYIAVAGVVIGLVFTREKPLPGRGKIAVAIGFFLFALSNNLALGRMQRLAYHGREVVQELRRGTGGTSAPGATAAVLDTSYDNLLLAVDASPPGIVQGAQVFSTLALLAAIGAMHHYEVRRRRGNSSRAVDGGND